jgi:hypothetical protein
MILGRGSRRSRSAGRRPQHGSCEGRRWLRPAGYVGSPDTRGDLGCPRSQRRASCFLHELGDILYVERKLADAVLPKLIQEAQDEEFVAALEEHLEQTRRHVANVEDVFSQLGETLTRSLASGSRG